MREVGCQAYSFVPPGTGYYVILTAYCVICMQADAVEHRRDVHTNEEIFKISKILLSLG